MSKMLRFMGDLKGFTRTYKARGSSNELVKEILSENFSVGEGTLYSQKKFSEGHEYSDKTLDWGVYTLLRSTSMIKRGLLFEVARGILDENTARQLSKAEGTSLVAGDIAFQITRMEMSNEQQAEIIDRRAKKMEVARAKRAEKDR